MCRANVLSSLFVAAVVMLASSTPASADPTSLVGKPAPDFSLPTLGGKVARLSAEKGKVVVICFWTSNPKNVYGWELLPDIQGFSANQDWASKGLVVWAITDAWQTAATLTKFLTDNKYTFDVPYDSTYEVFRNYLVAGSPVTVVIGSDGIIKNVILGFGTATMGIPAAVERALAESGKLDASALIGNPAPAFLLTAPNGAPIDLDDSKYNRKVMLITFWAGSNSSASILPHLQELAANQDFARKGLVVMAVATGGQTPADVRKFLLDKHYTFEVPFDMPFASWEDSLGKEMATFVIGRSRSVTSAFAGGGASVTKQVDNAVASALNESQDAFFRNLIGKPAPDISLPTLTGETVKLSDQRGKVVLIDFWATWCYWCQLTLPRTQKLSDNPDLAKKGLVVWAITVPDRSSLAEAQRYVASHKLTLIVPFDAKLAASSIYRIGGYPATFVVGRDGLIKYATYEFTKALDDSIASALAQPPPAVASNLKPTLPPAPSSPSKPVPSSPSPSPSSPTNPATSPVPAPLGTDPLAAIWQGDAYGGQTFRFKLDSGAIDIYGGQELLGVLQAKQNKGEIEMYEGLVRLAPVTQCPGGRGLMQIRTWNENRLDAKIETPVKSPNGITCGGILGSGRFIPWQKVTFAKR
jgi:peroxiredoxin